MMRRIDLTGKPIVITGASSGIGERAARMCAQVGMPVLVCARRTDRLEALAESINASGGNARAFTLDVRDADRCEAAIKVCCDAFGSIYAVFANAGFGYEQPFHSTPADAIKDIFDVNFFGSLNIIRPALPHLIEAKSGHVLLCSSCLAQLAIPGYGMYSATKAAQHHVGRAMRHELRPHGIHVSTVHPVGTRTEFFETVRSHSSTGTPVLDRTHRAWMRSPNRVARAIVRSLRRPRPEVWTSQSSRLVIQLGAMMPRTTDRVLRLVLRRQLARKKPD